MRFRLADVFFVAAAVCVSLFFILKPAGDQPKRLLLLTGERKITLPFMNGEIDLKKYTGRNMTLEVKDGGAMMKNSSCPDKICIKAGRIESCGDMIICMPNGTAVMIDCKGALDEN